jgi:serine/threonine protein kinase
MPMQSPRWTSITASQFEWERRALDFIQNGLPDHDPYRAWSNFEFQTQDGAIYEVDCLVLTKQGFWLVECKAYEGLIQGDSGTWTIRGSNHTKAVDNPVLLANRKAKALSSILKSQKAMKGLKLPWLDPLVFLSADNLQCELSGVARNHVVLKDQPAKDGKPETKGVLQALINRQAQGVNQYLNDVIDSKVSRSISLAIEQSGIRPSQRSRRVGDYILQNLIMDGVGYQDYLAKHAGFADQEIYCRVRQYTIAKAASEEERKKLKRIAEREFTTIQGLDHQGILPVLGYKDHENGPALFFKYQDPNAIRFDHFLISHGEKLEASQKLEFLRQIADSIRYSHNKRVIHCSLSPQSILVSNPDKPIPKLQIYNWPISIKQALSSCSLITNVDDVLESQQLVYMAPEALIGQKHISESADVFSLGAIAFHLFANQPPATNTTELSRILVDNKGLKISSIIDGAGQKLEELIQWSTHPDVLTRLGTVDDFLVLLSEVEEELTAPLESIIEDPLEAKKGDKLAFGFTVERDLGQGSTAKALLVTKNGKEKVLKVALKEESNALLEQEAKALESLHSEFIVDFEEILEMNGRTVLVLEKAGDQTLAALLQKEGVPSLDLLCRYGEDLLSALVSLERNGVNHRDIKPDNIGIRSNSKKRNQLILFDFSLTGVSIDNLKVGTEKYKDPSIFSRKPARWDVIAERFSVAVTLHEMALGYGEYPVYGKNLSNPALTDDELVLSPERFDSSVRETITAFFQKALQRDYTKRFDSAEAMLRGWVDAFKVQENKIITTTGKEIDVSSSIEDSKLDTPVSALGFSAMSINALERANIINVQDLLLYPIGDIYVMKGVTNQTRKEILNFLTDLREKHPLPDPKKNKEVEQASIDSPASVLSLESFYQRILGPKNERKNSEWNIRAAILGVTPNLSRGSAVWISQREVAAEIKLSAGRINHIIVADRKRWAKDPNVTEFRSRISDELLKLGGIITIEEIISLTIQLYPANSTISPQQQKVFASAIARAAVETEDLLDSPRFAIRRFRTKVIVAATLELANYFDKIGIVADKLAEADPLLPSARVFTELYKIEQPEFPKGANPPSNDRLIKLAAELGDNSALSSRQEIYPKNMPVERVFRLGVGALTGLGFGANNSFTVEIIKERLQSRYPQAQPIPNPPELDKLLREVGFDVKWNESKKEYERTVKSVLLTEGSSAPVRYSTTNPIKTTEVTPEIAEAKTFEDRLNHAFKSGGFLVLTVRPSRARIAEKELLKRFDLEKVSFDQLLFQFLKQKAQELEIDWAMIENADGSSHESQDWQNLLRVVDSVKDQILTNLLQRKKPTLLVHAGLIARYDLMILLENLRDQIGHENYCPCFWVLVADDGLNPRPILDHKVIPLISNGQRANISEPWMDNYHRSGNTTAKKVF